MWSAIGQWALIVLIGFITLTGLLYLLRGTVIRHVRGVGADGSPVAPSEPQFPLSVAMLTGAALLPGNRVDVALNGDGTFTQLWDDLRSATQSITLQLYYKNRGQLADTLLRILADRAAVGVHVYVLYDAFGTRGINSATRATLERAGVKAVAFRPLSLWTLHLVQNRSHVRGVVVDGRIGWTGGFGIDDKWAGDGRTNGSWRETNVRFEGPAVGQLQAAFAAAWAEATGVLLTGRMTMNEGPDSAGSTAGLMYAVPTMGSTKAERFLALSIAGATKSLYLTNPYFVPDRNFAALLADSARRGVDVRILTAGPKTDIRVVRLAGRAAYTRLLSAGVRIYEWQPSTLHSKTFVADGVWSTIGSINFDNRSLVLNDEATLMILDERIGRQMNEIFFEDLEDAEEISLESFQRRPLLDRVDEAASVLIARVL
ncbi:MAG TPA: phospholipase D-like domain-containing protein [Vicinamibacterales bacterium]|nr:phospholipase D-like domain-containing protein [Vicinamibacterales bacterium]